MSDEADVKIAEPLLETPPAPDSPGASGALGTLFSEDSMALVTSKLMVLEALLGLATRDYKFHDFMREVLVAIMKAVKSEAGSILEYDQRNNSLFFRSVVGRSSDRLANFVIPMGQGIVGHVAESRQPLVVANVEENRIYLKSVQNAVGFEARNLIALPIVVRGKLYGVLELLNRVGEENYTSSDVELLSYLCDMAAKVIEVRLMLAWAMRTAGSAPTGERDAA